MTQTDIEQVISELLSRGLDITGLDSAQSLDGISTFPAIQTTANGKAIVAVPISLLTQAIQTVINNAQSATAAAQSAAAGWAAAANKMGSDLVVIEGDITTLQNADKSLTALTSYAECPTAANVAAKAVTIADFALPTNGGCLHIKMTNANTATSGVTLNINATGAKSLFYNGSAVSATNSWEDGEVVEVFYDGTNYQASNTQGGGVDFEGVNDITTISDSANKIKLKDKDGSDAFPVSHSDAVKMAGEEKTLTEVVFDVSYSVVDLESGSPQYIPLPMIISVGKSYAIYISFTGNFDKSGGGKSHIADLRLVKGDITDTSNDIALLSNNTDASLKSFSYKISNESETYKNKLRIALGSGFTYSNETISIKIVDLTSKNDKVKTDMVEVSNHVDEVEDEVEEVKETLQYSKVSEKEPTNFTSSNYYALGFTLKAGTTYRLKLTTSGMVSTDKVTKISFNNAANATGMEVWQENSNGLAVKNTSFIADFTPSAKNMTYIVIAFSSSSTKSGAWGIEVFEYVSIFDRLESLEEPVTPKRTDFFEKVAAGNNLLNPSDIGTDRIVNRSTGAISTGQTGYYATGFIPIDERGLYCDKAPTNLAGVRGIAYYSTNDASGYIKGVQNVKYIPYVTNAKYVRITLTTNEEVMVNVGSSAKPYEAYAGTKSQMKKELLPSAIIGDGDLTFSKFDDAASMEKGVGINLPNEIVVPVGRTLQIFHRSVVEAINPYQYVIEAVCNIGKNYPRYFTLTPTTSDLDTNNADKTYPLTYYIRRNNNTLITSKSTTIRVTNMIEENAVIANGRILMVGGSHVNSGYIQAELRRMLTTDTQSTSGVTQLGNIYPKGLNLSGVSFVGRKSIGITFKEKYESNGSVVENTVATISGTKYEATGGYSWSTYVNGRNAYWFKLTEEHSVGMNAVYRYSSGGVNYDFTIVEVNGDEIRGTYEGTVSLTDGSTGTLTKMSGGGDSSLQFSNCQNEIFAPFGTGNNISFNNYADDYCKLSESEEHGKIDIIVFSLGTNDVFSNSTTVKTNALKLIDAFHRDFPNGKVIIVSPLLPDPNGGMGNSYGADSDKYWNQIARRMYDLYGTYQEIASDANYSGFVSFVHAGIFVDIENAYQYTDARVNARVAVTERLGTNGVHPSQIGYSQMADAIFYKLQKLL